MQYWKEWWKGWEGGIECRDGWFRRQGIRLKKIGKGGWVAREFKRKGRGSGGRDGERNSRLQERQRIILIRLCDYICTKKFASIS
jgi:hypothetical protein